MCAPDFHGSRRRFKLTVRPRAALGRADMAETVRENRRRRARIAAMATVLLAAAASPALAHGELDEEIAALTSELARRPRDPELLLGRAELHRVNGELEAARVDLEAAGRAAPDLRGRVELGKAALCLEARRTACAEEAIARAAAAGSGGAALLLRAKLRQLEERPAEAAADLGAAAARLPRPEPDVYLTRARLRAAPPLERWSDAIAAIDEGLVRLGPVPSLAEAAIELEGCHGRFVEALARVERWTAPSHVRLARRAELLAAAGRIAEARAARRAAIAALDALPAVARARPANAALRARLVHPQARAQCPPASPPDATLR
jgi:hypothetical protein